jgi:hypothetical protein
MHGPASSIGWYITGGAAGGVVYFVRRAVSRILSNRKTDREYVAETEDALASLMRARDLAMDQLDETRYYQWTGPEIIADIFRRAHEAEAEVKRLREKLGIADLGIAEFTAGATETKNFHTEHCCQKHGCKYGYDDCPVVTGQQKQSFPCESCVDEEPATDCTPQGA